jgi:hypothetical protein
MSDANINSKALTHIDSRSRRSLYGRLMAAKEQGYREYGFLVQERSANMDDWRPYHIEVQGVDRYFVMELLRHPDEVLRAVRFYEELVQDGAALYELNACRQYIGNSIRNLDHRIDAQGHTFKRGMDRIIKNLRWLLSPFVALAAYAVLWSLLMLFK